MRLKELTAMLPANLGQVSDRWADGLGPLALCFTADEVIGLVLAMFERTGRRDELVGRIRRRPSLHLS